MTADELSQIRARADAATSGDWTFTGPSGPTDDTPEGGDFAIRNAGHIIAETFHRTALNTTQPAFGNATFIAHARTDIPRVLDALEAAQRDVEAISAGRDAVIIVGEMGLAREKELTAERDALKADNDRLRAALTKIRTDDVIYLKDGTPELCIGARIARAALGAK